MFYLLVYNWKHLLTGQTGTNCAYFINERDASQWFDRWKHADWEYTKDIYASGKVTPPQGIELYPKVYPWPNHHFTRLYA